MLRQLLGCLLVARSMAAFLPPPGAAHLGSHAVLGQRGQSLRSPNNAPPKNARAVNSPGLRVAMVDSSEALKQLQEWGGAPANSKFVCATSKSDAGVMAEIFSALSSHTAEQQITVIAPNCRSASDTKTMTLLSEHLKRSCDGANLQALNGAPQAAMTFVATPAPPQPSTELTEAEVMEAVLDWFQAMLVTLTDEEDFIEIGRILLSVKQYSVNTAVSATAFQAGFWKDVAALVEGGEGNTMMVAPNFMLDDPDAFKSFVERQLELPLAEWASEGKQLRVSFYHPAGPKKSPWPIIQIYFFDPAPQKDIDYGDVDFETEIEWGQTTKEELLEAKARAEQTEGKTVNNPAPKMPPSIPLEIEIDSEIDPLKAKGFGSDNAGGKGKGKGPAKGK